MSDFGYVYFGVNIVDQVVIWYSNETPNYVRVNDSRVLVGYLACFSPAYETYIRGLFKNQDDLREFVSKEFGEQYHHQEIVGDINWKKKRGMTQLDELLKRLADRVQTVGQFRSVERVTIWLCSKDQHVADFASSVIEKRLPWTWRDNRWMYRDGRSVASANYWDKVIEAVEEVEGRMSLQVRTFGGRSSG